MITNVSYVSQLRKQTATRHQGKVRDIFDCGSHLLLVASNRVSAFDHVLPTPISGKGAVLTELSQFWFERIAPLTAHHLITTDLTEMERTHGVFITTDGDEPMLEGRCMLVEKLEVVPVECIVRGYLAGSGWKEYQHDQAVCGIELPAGLQDSARLPEPLFTPSTKAPQGAHDENISFEQMVRVLDGDREFAELLKARSLELYRYGAEHANNRDVIIADTKFEWGRRPNDELVLIDEVLTPDSSRFWPAEEYQPGQSQPSFDKQIVRDWLKETRWFKEGRDGPPPELPNDIVARVQARYREVLELLTADT